jgi:hypothetical protein
LPKPRGSRFFANSREFQFKSSVFHEGSGFDPSAFFEIISRDEYDFIKGIQIGWFVGRQQNCGAVVYLQQAASF